MYPQNEMLKNDILCLLDKPCILYNIDNSKECIINGFHSIKQFNEFFKYLKSLCNDYKNVSNQVCLKKYSICTKGVVNNNKAQVFISVYLEFC